METSNKATSRQAHLPNMHVLKSLIKAMELFAKTEGENETLPNVTTTNRQNERYEKKKTRDYL